MCLQSCESLPSIHQLLVLEELRLVYGYRKDTGGAGTYRGHTRDPRGHTTHKGTRYTGTRLFKIAGHSAEQRPSYLLPDRHVRGTRTPVLFRTAIMHAI